MRPDAICRKCGYRIETNGLGLDHGGDVWWTKGTCKTQCPGSSDPNGMHEPQALTLNQALDLLRD